MSAIDLTRLRDDDRESPIGVIADWLLCDSSAEIGRHLGIDIVSVVRRWASATSELQRVASVVEVEIASRRPSYAVRLCEALAGSKIQRIWSDASDRFVRVAMASAKSGEATPVIMMRVFNACIIAGKYSEAREVARYGHSRWPDDADLARANEVLR